MQGFKGADLYGSGPTALFEIARLFSRLYSQTKSPYNLAYLLTGGGRLNYYGTRQWLHTAAPAVLDTVEFALCIESIARETLYLHVSRKPKDPSIKHLYDVCL